MAHAADDPVAAAVVHPAHLAAAVVHPAHLAAAEAFCAATLCTPALLPLHHSCLCAANFPFVRFHFVQVVVVSAMGSHPSSPVKVRAVDAGLCSPAAEHQP